MDFTWISEGTSVVNKEILFSEEDIVRFLSVSGGEVSSYMHEEALVVPSTLMAGKALGTMLGETGIPKGTLHTTQKIQQFHSVSGGSNLIMEAIVTKNKKRADTRFLTIEIRLYNHRGEKVLFTSSGLIIRSESI